MEDPWAHPEPWQKDPLGYVRRKAEALPLGVRGAWLLGVASGFLWPEAPPPMDLSAFFRRLEGAWRESEAYFLETGLDFPLLVSEWARKALEPLLYRKRKPPYPRLRQAFAEGSRLGQALRARQP
ncbi:hypothetical protein ACFFFP_07250 [Thermus composti]|uniref:Uncharacterized protein n=1 Tax=Thermus composti TaxID=532059 RepID=A0ABV6Q3Y2_9DEIN|nr:hypothetical protein [Thermus composti]